MVARAWVERIWDETAGGAVWMPVSGGEGDVTGDGVIIGA